VSKAGGDDPLGVAHVAATKEELGRLFWSGLPNYFTKKETAMETIEELPNALTPVTPRQLYEALKVAWLELWSVTMGTPSRDSLLVLLAQWALETGEGHSMHCFNIGNAKSRPGDGRCWTYFRCNEVERGADGKEHVVWYDPPAAACRFRAFRTLDGGARDYLALLRKQFDHAWPCVLSGDPAGFAHELRTQGYYTASEVLYTRTLTNIFRQYQSTLGLPFDVHTAAGLQRALNLAGASPPLAEDGVAGERTRAATKAFQRAHGLAVDGIAGPRTIAALALALGPSGAPGGA
jgi:hypothetical protein